MDLVPIRTGIAPIDLRLKRINTMQSAVALLGGASIVAGVNLYLYAQPLGDQTLLTLSTALFVGGWLTMALSVSGGTYESVVPPTLKSIIAFTSAVAIIAGTMIKRQQVATAVAGKPSAPGDLGMVLFLGGWAGIGLSMMMGNWRLEKIIATIVAIGITLGGIFWRINLQAAGKNQMPGKIVFGGGMIAMALAVGFAG